MYEGNILALSLTDHFGFGVKWSANVSYVVPYRHKTSGQFMYDQNFLNFQESRRSWERYMEGMNEDSEAIRILNHLD